MKSSLLRAVVGAFLLASLTGCATIRAGQPLANGYRLTGEETRLLRGRLHDADRPRLALAMSGGGLRSSLYNFGVLKALYDDGLLKDVDLVSSVSGGSYLAYYLYTQQARDPAKAFGAGVFDDTVFAKRTCELVANSNFVTYGNIAWSGLKRPFSDDAFRRMYEDQIRITYGGSDGGLVLPEIAAMVSEHHVPYLVVNATTYGGRHARDPWNARTFEFTPVGYGTKLGGYTRWRDAPERVGATPLLFAATASGAALKPLRRQFHAPFQGQGSVELWDGGKAENLGAATALMRGSRELIVVDAQYDDRGKPLGAYRTLQERMEDLGVGVTLDMRKPHTDVDVYPGRAVGADIDAQLAYVKMDIPPVFREGVYSPAGEARLLSALRGVDEQYWEKLGTPVDRKWQCERLGTFAFTPEGRDDWLYLQAGSYLRFAERRGLWPRVVRSDPWLMGSAVNHAFPRTTTVDQSFYIDQALAFIGLGYVTAKGHVRERLRGGTGDASEARDSAL